MSTPDGIVTIKAVLDDADVSKNLDKIESLAKKGAAATVTALAAVTTAVVKTGSEYEAQMSRVQAISGATTEEIAQLDEVAKKLGADTVFSATEAAAGMENLASAGFAVNDIAAAMPGLLDLAAVSGGDVAAAADVAATAINAFGLEASQAGHVADVFARAAADTNAEALDMGEAMKYVAPVANAMGISLEESAAAVGIMSDAGIKGSQAGTTLRAALSRLAKPTEKMTETMDKLGISFYDSNGKMLPLKKQVEIMQKSFKGLTEEEKQNALVTLYGQEALSGMMALIEAGPDKLGSLTESLENSNGAAEEMASTMMDNTKGAFEDLMGTVETVGLNLYDKFSEPLQDSIKKIDQYVSGADEKIISLIDTVQGLTPVIAGATAAFAAYKTAMFITGTIDSVKKALDGATLAQAALNSVMNLNPYVAVATTVAALTAAIAALVIEIANSNEAYAEVAEANSEMTEKNEELTSKIDAQRDSYNKLRETVEANAGAREAELEYAEDLFASLQNITDETGKIKKGEEDRAKFIVDTLNEVLGTNIEIIGNQVQGYKDLQDEITKTIEQEKAQILLEGQKEVYIEAIRNMTSAQKDLTSATDNVTDAEKKLADAMKHKEDLAKQAEQTDLDFFNSIVHLAENKKAEQAIEDAEINLEKAKDNADKSREVLAQYYADMYQYEDAAEEARKGNADKVIEILTTETDAYKKATTDKKAELNQQKEDAATAYKDSLVILENYNEMYGNSEDKRHKEEIERLTKQAVEAKEEAENVGVEIVNGMIQGIGSKGDELNRTVEQMINSIPKESRELLGIHSPSKVMANDIGKNVPLGVAEGIADEADSVVKEMQSLYENMENVEPPNSKGFSIGGVTLPENFFAKGKTAAEEWRNGFVSALRDANFAVNVVMAGMAPTLAVAGAAGTVQRTESYSESVSTTKVVVEAKGDLLDIISVKQYESGEKID